MYSDVVRTTQLMSADTMLSKVLRCLISFIPGVAFFILVVGFSGCSLFFDDGETTEEPVVAEPESTSNPEPEETPEPEEETEAKEVAPAKAATESTPEGDLIRVAEKLYQAGMFSLAKQSFQSLRDQYPLGAYAPLAEIKLADAYFYNREFVEASKKYDEFAKSHPGSADVPYVKLQAARSLLSGSKGLGRDRGPLERALTLLDTIVQEYPQSAYAALAEKERTKVAEDLASYDQLIIEFYQKLGNTAAVDARTKLYKERWSARLARKSPPTLSSSKPMSRLAFSGGSEARPAIALNSRSISNDTVLSSTTRDEVARETPDVRASIASANERTSDSGAAPSPITTLSHRSPLPEPPFIQKVVCRGKGTQFALIELSREPQAPKGGSASSTLEPEDGVVRISGYPLQSVQKSFDCFGVGDLQLTAENELQLLTERNVTVTTLSHPFRLVLVPEHS